MKNKFSIPALALLLLVAGLTSCEKNNQKDELSDEVLNFLQARTRMNAMNAAGGQMNNFMTVIAESQIKGGDEYIDGVNYDSSWYENYCDTCYWEYTSCAEVTEITNDDGTVTTVYDYGDGCYEYGWLTKGKITYIWSSEGNKYYSKVIYDNYYSYGMTMNGYSEYSFESDGNSWVSVGYETDAGGSEGDSTVYIPEYNFVWSGTSAGSEDYTMIFDSGETYSYSSEYSNKWDSLSYTVEVGYYHYSSESEGYEYTYEVTEPLVSNYSCPDTWVPVSGVETTRYTSDSTTVDFTIDYGNGNCDNLAEVTENGNTVTIDFAEYYQICYDEPVSDAVLKSAGSRR
ncbi:MAG: hypothetical protein ACOYXB_06880 [Bacteroidota bacterium]